MGNPNETAATASETEKRTERPKTPSGRVKADPGPLPDPKNTKHVKFSREHIHRGIRYAIGDEADLLAPEADAIIAMGSAGEQKGAPSQRVDVVAAAK